jgi:hypothetical protein
MGMLFGGWNENEEYTPSQNYSSTEKIEKALERIANSLEKIYDVLTKEERTKKQVEEEQKAQKLEKERIALESTVICYEYCKQISMIALSQLSSRINTEYYWHFANSKRRLEHSSSYMISKSMHGFCPAYNEKEFERICLEYFSAIPLEIKAQETLNGKAEKFIQMLTNNFAKSELVVS